MENPFRYYLRVRYGECDAQKIVFNSRYGDFLDVASVEFLRAIHQADLEFHLVKQTVEWKAPARFDNVLEISVATKHVGNTSFSLVMDIRRAGKEPLLVTSETVYVVIDHVTMTKTSISETLRAALLKGAPGVRVDHAGYFGSPVPADAIPVKEGGVPYSTVTPAACCTG